MKKVLLGFSAGPKLALELKLKELDIQDMVEIILIEDNLSVEEQLIIENASLRIIKNNLIYMVSKLRELLTLKQQAGLLTDEFCSQVGISRQRVDGIIFGRYGATIKELINVAKYFNLPTSHLLEREPPRLIEFKTCAHCQGDFIPTNSRQDYCTDKCRNRAFRANLK